MDKQDTRSLWMEAILCSFCRGFEFFLHWPKRPFDRTKMKKLSPPGRTSRSRTKRASGLVSRQSSSGCLQPSLLMFCFSFFSVCLFSLFITGWFCCSSRFLFPPSFSMCDGLRYVSQYHRNLKEPYILAKYAALLLQRIVGSGIRSGFSLLLFLVFFNRELSSGRYESEKNGDDNN